MTDRELLELAVKAASYRIEWRQPLKNENPADAYAWDLERLQAWNPRDNDGDALRLAVKLGLQIFPDDMRDGSVCVVQSNDDEVVCAENCGNDPYAAVRLAIVRAAAEIGKAMP